MRKSRLLILSAVVTGVALFSGTALAAQQWTPEKRGSDNIEVIAHLPLGADLSVSDIEIEQELSRPFVYVAREIIGGSGDIGMDVLDISDERNPEVIHRWRIENQDLHTGSGGKDIKYFKWNDRYYVVLALQFAQGGPDNDLGAIIFDVTGLPDASTFREVGRIRDTDNPGGFHNIFIYKHSNGRVLLFTTVRGPMSHVYDLGYIVDGQGGEEGELALVADVPIGQEDAGSMINGYHDLYVSYHPDTEQDRFYGGGTGGYYVYDVTDLENPKLEITLTGISGVDWGHTFTPSPDGRYAVGETEYQYAPLRIYDMKPALDGEVENIRSPISAWTADWQHLVHNHEVRWPFVFVSGYVDGLQVFSLMDPKNPVTLAWYDTYLPATGMGGGIMAGAWGVDVRNEDGLIVISDMSTGYWAFRMEGFSGWNGEMWGYPNISSAQDWENGPGGGREQR